MDKFFDYVRDLNAKNWTVLNCFQYGNGSLVRWRVNLQKRTETGTTVNVFTEFSDNADPLEAMKGAFVNAVRCDKENDGRTRSTLNYAGAESTKVKAIVPASPALKKRLDKALDDNFAARKGLRDGRS